MQDTPTIPDPQTLETWCQRHGAPPEAVAAATTEVLVVAAGDITFGQHWTEWVEFDGPLCDDGGVLLARYRFHSTVELEQGSARLLAVLDQLNPAPAITLFPPRPQVHWGFFAVVSPA